MNGLPRELEFKHQNICDANPMVIPDVHITGIKANASAILVESVIFHSWAVQCVAANGEYRHTSPIMLFATPNCEFSHRVVKK